MKKIAFSIICIFCVLISLFGCSSSEFHYDKFYFEELENGYRMSRSYGLFNKYEGILYIPETYENKHIVEIESINTVFGRGITEIVGSKNLESINAWALSGNDGKPMPNLTRVEFPKDGNLKKIETMAFYWCNNLSTVIVPEGFESFGSGVFEKCTNLTTLVIFNPTPPSFGDLFNMHTLNDEYFHTKPHPSFTVYVPDEAIETYKQSAWSGYRIEPISNIEHIIKLPSTTNNATNNEQPQKGFGVGHVIAISISGAILLTLCVIVIINYKKCKIVFKNSERIKRLLELNKTVNFRIIQYRYNNQQACNSKRQLDNLSLDDYLIGLITSNESFYRNIIESISSNRNKYYSYIRQTETIRTTATEEFCKELGFSLKRFLKYENRVFKWKKLRKPQFNVTVHCKVTYTSPQGRNHYWKEESYNFDELKRLYDHTVELKAQRQTRQYQIKVERAKMTDSLRYDILKRDNYRCQICGSCASDGVKLHVDHIIPVAKGGQTVASNLRTLCDRCNMGKSDKM